MKPLIVVSSKTGNTRVIARALQDALGACGYVNAADMPEDLADYNPIVLCFWCDRGMAPEDMAAAAAKIRARDIACFATLGGDPTSEQARAWMNKTSAQLVAAGEGNTLKTEFLCRGRIDPAVFEMMTAKAGGKVTPERERVRRQSEAHPDRLDTLAAIQAYKSAFGA